MARKWTKGISQSLQEDIKSTWSEYTTVVTCARVVLFRRSRWQEGRHGPCLWQNFTFLWPNRENHDEQRDGLIY
jgi:hypothetical protein